METELIESTGRVPSRRSFLKTCGGCIGALALGLGAAPGVASVSDYIVRLGENKTFSHYNYSWCDPKDVFDDGVDTFDPLTQGSLRIHTS